MTGSSRADSRWKGWRGYGVQATVITVFWTIGQTAGRVMFEGPLSRSDLRVWVLLGFGVGLVSPVTVGRLHRPVPTLVRLVQATTIGVSSEEARQAARHLHDQTVPPSGRTREAAARAARQYQQHPRGWLVATGLVVVAGATGVSGFLLASPSHPVARAVACAVLTAAVGLLLLMARSAEMRRYQHAQLFLRLLDQDDQQRDPGGARAHSSEVAGR